MTRVTVETIGAGEGRERSYPDHLQARIHNHSASVARDIGGQRTGFHPGHSHVDQLVVEFQSV